MGKRPYPSPLHKVDQIGIIAAQQKKIIHHYFPKLKLRGARTTLLDLRRYYATLVTEPYGLEPPPGGSNEDYIAIINYFRADLKLSNTQMDILCTRDWKTIYDKYYKAMGYREKRTSVNPNKPSQK